MVLPASGRKPGVPPRRPYDIDDLLNQHTADIAARPTKSVADTLYPAKAATEAAIGRVDPGTAGSNQQFAVWDESLGRVGWFGMPVLLSGWGGHKIDATGTATGQHTALNAFFNAAATAGMGAVLMPGTYVPSALVMPPSGLTLFAHGATIKRPAGWDINSMLYLNGVEGVTIRGLTVDGTRASYTPAQNKHNIQIHNSRHVTLEDVTSIDAAGDGLILSDSSNAAEVNEYITVTRFRAENCGRNGLSVIGGRHVTFHACHFTGSNGVAPEAGCDIEPNYATTVCEDIAFYGCHFDDNVRRGVEIVTKDTLDGHQSGYRFYGGSANDNEYGAQIVHAHSVEFHGFDFKRNSIRGVYLAENMKYIAFYGGTIALSGQNGFTVTGSGGSVVEHLRIIGTEVRDNGQSAANTYDGINLGNTVTDALIEGVTSTGTSQRRGLATNVNGTHISVVDCDLRGNGTGGANLLDDRATRFVRGNRGYVSNRSGVTSVATGGTIAHGLSGQPSRYGATGTVAGEIVTVTSVNSTNFTINITKHDGTAGTTQNVAWWAEI